MAVILAAGKGTRMRSARPKVLHRAAGRPLLAWVIDAARDSGCERLLIVCGHGADELRREIVGDDIVWVQQAEQLGTGHALAQVEPYIDTAATLLVLSGDVPLVSPRTLDRLAVAADAGWGAAAVAELERPGALGRIITRQDVLSTTGDEAVIGHLERIVEAADATPDELSIPLVNAGIYALPAPEIFTYLRRLRPDNAKGELYLTDALGDAAKSEEVSLVRLTDTREAFGVNDRRDLAIAHQALGQRLTERLMADGVTILDPQRTQIEAAVRVGPDTVIHPGVSLLGNTRIGASCEIHQGAWIRDSTLADQVAVEPYSVIDGATIAETCHVGPFARLRPASKLLRGSRVGNFVELKNAELGADSKAGHLAYLGDVTVGDEANIGAGVVTCNYDGISKHPTTIGHGAFVGSDTMLVAPVKVGERAATGAGSVITRNVPDRALGIGRERQKNIPEWDAHRAAKKQDSTSRS